MDNLQKQILSENQSILISLNTKLGLYINASDIRAFQILTRAVSQIIDQRQVELLTRSQENEHTVSLYE